MRHLFDGDASSNTLSWRWVAGMHTNNKPYIATRENINKYTVNRFIDSKFILNKTNTEIIKPNIHKSNKLPTKSKTSNSNILIMFENDMNIRNRSKLFNSYLKVYLIYNGINNNRFELSQKVIEFKQNLVKKVVKLIPNSFILELSELETLLYDQKYIDVVYPGIGHNLDTINEYGRKMKIIINYIYREEDLIYWNYANSGFNKFKKSFYRLNNI